VEDLTKHQLVLLTLLVSFVTSIATGIITFTLLQEAPIEVTQTINRVVERTIEQVVPNDGGKEIVREVQVVSEEDLVLESISKSAKSVVRIKTLGFDGTEIVTGLGVVIGEGLVVADAQSITGGSNYTVIFPDSKAYGVAKTYTSNGMTFLKIGKPANEKYTFFPASLGNADSLKLGQTVIAISGKVTNSVSIGRVSQIEKTSDASGISRIMTDIRFIKAQPGSPLLNLAGEIIGFESGAREGDSVLTYIPISIVKNDLKTATDELAK
jgi:S1-C subfamily serine protease